MVEIISDLQARKKHVTTQQLAHAYIVSISSISSTPFLTMEVYFLLLLKLTSDCHYLYYNTNVTFASLLVFFIAKLL